MRRRSLLSSTPLVFFLLVWSAVIDCSCHAFVVVLGGNRPILSISQPASPALSTRWSLSYRDESLDTQQQRQEEEDTTKASSSTTSITRRSLFSKTTTLSATSLLLLSSSCFPQSTHATTLDAQEARRISVFEKTSPSVVYIDTFTERRDSLTTNVLEVPLGAGSGIVWDRFGHVVTNFHVVRNARTAQVAILLSGKDALQAKDAVSNSTKTKPSNSLRKVFDAQIVGVDPGKDLAVLKIQADPSFLFPIAIGRSKDIKVGSSCLAIGNPFGLDHTLTAGIISGTGREVKSPIGRPITNVLQSDAAINPGNSGGPLLDGSGKLIGVNTAIYSPTGASAGIGFAIPVDEVKFIVETLIRDGRIVRPVLGISYLGSKQARTLGINSGVLVLDVPEDSLPAKAGLKGTRRTESGLIELGDIIVQVGDCEIEKEADLFQALEDLKPGDVVQVTVNRVVAVSDELAVRKVKLEIELSSSAKFEKSFEPFSSSPRRE